MRKLIELFKKMNQSGLPMPLLRDGVRGGSYTLTMFWISFNVCIIALAGKVAQVAGGIEYHDCLWLLALTGSFYLGRTLQIGKDGINLEGGTTTSVNQVTTTVKNETINQ